MIKTKLKYGYIYSSEVIKDVNHFIDLYMLDKVTVKLHYMGPHKDTDLIQNCSSR